MLQFILLLATAVLVGIDQLTKYLVTSNMQIGQSIPVVDGVFERCITAIPARLLAFFRTALDFHHPLRLSSCWLSL